MRRLNYPTLERLSEVLHYSPTAGTLVWQQDRPPGARRGMNAGYLNATTGNITVTIDGHRYQAHHIAWYIAKQSWPAHQIVFRDQDSTNLKLDNLRSVEEVYADNPKARSARERRQRRAARRAEAFTIPDLTNEAFSVTYDARLGLWSVYDNGVGVRFYQYFKTRAEAENFAKERLRILPWVMSYNKAYKSRPGDDLIPAGTEAGTETYAEIAAEVAYNPIDGHIYYRDIQRHSNLQADKLTASGRPVVSLFGRYFPCAMLAWFLTHRTWPKPKQIGWRNGNNKDNRLSNLMNLKAQR